MTVRLVAVTLAILALAYVGWRIVDMVAAGRVVKATETYNQEGRDAADEITKARARVRACHERGGMSWDRETGQCRPAVPGARK